MALPKKLRDFNLFGDGESWLGQITEVTLPTLTRLTEDYRGGGMQGAVEMDMGQDKIELQWTAGGMIEAIFDAYGAPTMDAHLLRFTGSYEDDSEDAVMSVEIVVRGRHREIDSGTAKNGDNNEIKVTTACSYYKLTIDGRDAIEIDIPGNIFIVNGVDRLAQRRAALGI